MRCADARARCIGVHPAIAEPFELLAATIAPHFLGTRSSGLLAMACLILIETRSATGIPRAQSNGLRDFPEAPPDSKGPASLLLRKYRARDAGFVRKSAP